MVNLIITDQPNLFVDYGIHSTLDNNCHHQIIHGKINIYVRSPPSYKRQIWNNAKAHKDEIRQSLTLIGYLNSRTSPPVTWYKNLSHQLWA